MLWLCIEMCLLQHIRGTFPILKFRGNRNNCEQGPETSSIKANNCLLLSDFSLGIGYWPLVGNTTAFKVLEWVWELTPSAGCKYLLSDGELITPGLLHWAATQHISIWTGVRHFGGCTLWSSVLQWAELPNEFACRHLCLLTHGEGEGNISLCTHYRYDGWLRNCAICYPHTSSHLELKAQPHSRGETASGPDI